MLIQELPISHLRDMRIAILMMISAAVTFGQCGNVAALRGHGHMDLGVKLSGNSAFVAAETQALNFWATVLDMSWHTDTTSECAIEFRPVQTVISARADSAVAVAAAHLPGRGFDGVVYFKYANGYDKARVFKHELGHIFGLEHDENQDSIMYFDPESSNGELTAHDLKSLAKRHELRHGN